jgi:hypothetical protein
MIRFIPCSELLNYFSILRSQLSPGIERREEERREKENGGSERRGREVRGER